MKSNKEILGTRSDHFDTLTRTGTYYRYTVLNSMKEAQLEVIEAIHHEIDIYNWKSVETGLRAIKQQIEAQ